jgi:hypothetical protein
MRTTTPHNHRVVLTLFGFAIPVARLEGGSRGNR